MPKCKGCGREIVWIKTNVGNAMPCDPRMVTYWAGQGKKERIVTPNGEVIACTLDGDPQKATGVGYVPHWSTCPGRKMFTKKKTDDTNISLDF